ncbi:RNase P subunit p30 family protein [Cryptosporidium felis]|nr:RNase P subunit p30 family protein [Cryptosporidium felis]
MSFEICVSWPGSLDEAKRLVQRAYDLGYFGIAFNNVLDLVEKCNKIRSGNKKNSTTGNILSALAKEGHISPVQYIQVNKQELHSSRGRQGPLNCKGGCSPALAKNTFLSLGLSCHSPEVNGKFGSEEDISLDFLQLRRLTVIFDSPDCVPYINALSRGPCNEASDSWSKALFSTAPNHHPYDLVAVRPTTQSALNSAISSLECDIISIDISSSSRLPFIIKRPQVNLAISRGIFFEIDVSQCLSNKGNSRRNFFSNILALTRHVPHKNILFTCNPKSPFDLKTPIDLSNICHVILSLDLDRKVRTPPFDFVSSNAIRALSKGTNRRSFASVIFISTQNADQDREAEMEIL